MYPLHPRDIKSDILLTITFYLIPTIRSYSLLSTPDLLTHPITFYLIPTIRSYSLLSTPDLLTHPTTFYLIPTIRSYSLLSTPDLLTDPTTFYLIPFYYQTLFPTICSQPNGIDPDIYNILSTYIQRLYFKLKL